MSTYNDKEKIEMLRDTIFQLYSKEGRSLSYIAKLLSVDRDLLSGYVKDNKIEKANVHRLSKSIQKFVNKNREHIIKVMENSCKTGIVSDLASHYGVGRNYIYNIINKDEKINNAYNEYKSRCEKRKQRDREILIENSNRDYSFKDIDGEIWKLVPNTEYYYISNYGRLKHYNRKYKIYNLLIPNTEKSGYLSYGFTLNNGKFKVYKLHRLVAYLFLSDSMTAEKKYVNHKNGDKKDNRVENLEWCTIADNNKYSYDVLDRKVSYPYTKHGLYRENGQRAFKCIVLDNKYEFKTITALAKFLNISSTQCARYIDGEVKSCEHVFKIIQKG